MQNGTSAILIINTVFVFVIWNYYQEKISQTGKAYHTYLKHSKHLRFIVKTFKSSSDVKRYLVIKL